MANEGQPVNLSLLLALLQEMPAYRQLVRDLSTAESEHKAVVLDAARPYVIAALYHELNVPIMVVTAQPESARKLHEQLRVWCPPSVELHRLPELDFLPYDSYRLSAFSRQMLERLRALTILALHGPLGSWHCEGAPMKSGRPKNLLDSGLHEESEDPSLALRATQAPLIVASALAIMSKTIPHGDFVAACHVLEPGMAADPLELLRRWQTMGYEVEDVVEVPGQMSKRGGIVDVFTPFSELPVRIEFFGNRIESMRCFDPESQRSSGPISSLILTPARELMPMAENSRLAILDSDSCTPEVKQRFEVDLVRLQERQWFPGAEFYFPLFNTGSVFDYLGRNALLILDEPEGIGLVVTRLNRETQELRATKMERGELPQDFPSPYLAWEELESQMEVRHRLTMETWNAPQGYGQALPFVRPQSYGGQLERFLTTARKLVEQGQRVLVVSHQANRLAELLQKEDIHTSPASEIEQVPPPGSITVLQGSLDGGWLMADGLTLITDTELFGFVKQPRAGKKKRIPRRWFLPQLVPGDYVVHVDHGIARFNGLTRMFSHGIEGEYLVLEYAAGDRLYVPIERIDRISRYIGAGDQAPPLSRLRSREWQRTKRRVKESVAEIAHELLDLYAAREIAPGFAFSPDSLWQQELEASFPYMETPDQVEAIMTVKKDMEGAKPTDRLICGDVGYGKTEIALRAAFKAVMDNKQVAILVPTTILAQQHLITFTERLQTFPLRVEMLSRFCPPEKEREIIAGLANGTVDICIGTHRLLQKDISFKDLGMVIIDEEQQFGVVQKEKLRQIRKEVDTLALSATPIPRTLHMSLSGIRDMSIVETPPEERLSIKTYVGVYDATLVRQVILRELERNGQVFFVHNRVQSIGLAAGKLQDLVPEVRIAIAHGQMHEEQLEKVMADFVSRKYDVLLTTTIIQLGLDMPNVNTLIVNQADKFGLGQLYQLRGRVGRGINQAYAYFLFDEGKLLTPQAHKRLRTIFEAAELGSGFGIAMKDLEIRGAGNLLGVKQSGHIAALGFDLYCQLLAEAVEESKASSPNISPEGRGTGEGGIKRSVVAGQQNESPSISLPLAAYIPEEYVPNLGTRLGLYHRLAGLELIEEVADFVQEFKDRFGALPQPVDNLLYMVKIKVLAIKAGVSSVSRQGRQIVIRPRTEGGRLTVSSAIDAAVKTGATQIRLDTRLAGDRWQDVLEEILRSNCG
ncbi:MAG: transcription-repair coupling factor [Dehalococcoidia bacterium]|nr:MAG: transcription-repair coupling factor [Dehalococcoidia bacterium]